MHRMLRARDARLRRALAMLAEESVVTDFCALDCFALAMPA